MQQLKSQKDMAKLFESPQQSGKGAKDKENRVVKIKGVKLTSTTSSSVKSNQSSPQKQSSKTSTRHILRYSLRSNSAKKSQTKSNPSSPSKHSSSRQSSQSPSKSPPPKPTSSSQVVSGPGSCKECPFVLSSGESDHEVPLPPLETKQKPKVNSVTSIGKELPAKPTIQPFQLKKERGPFVSTVNQLTAKGKGLAKVVPSETPPTAPLTAQQQPAKKTTKVLPAQEKSKNDPKTSQQKNPSQLPAHMPVLKAAGNPAKRAPAACILPPPPPPPPHYSYPYNPYAQCPPRYGHPQPMPPPFQHHTGPYHSGYHPQYTFSGSGLPSARYGGYISRGSGLPYSRSAHPLTTHYSATY